MHPFAQDVAAFAAARGLLDASSRTLVALSGGPDSCALLLALLEVAADGRLPRPVAAAHFHHGMRGADADADAAFAASLCARFGLPCSIGIGAVPAERRRAKGRERRSPHDAARHSRYAFLRAAAAEFGADVIATAHTADDQAETVLLRVLRGAGTEGLTGIPPERPLAPGLRVVRPLLNARRADVEAYCRDRGVTPRRDPSNDSVSYARSRVRRLLPDLARDFNPRIGDALVRLAEIAAADADLLREWTDALWARAATLSPRRVELDAGLLRAEHPALRRRILLRALRHAAADGAVVASADDAATAANVGAAEKLLVEDRPGATVDLAGGVRVESDGRGRLRVAFGVAWHPAGAYRLPLPVPGHVWVGPAAVWLRAEVCAGLPPPAPPFRRAPVALVACGRMGGGPHGTAKAGPVPSFLVRSAAPGDRITPPGMRGSSRSVRDVMADAGWPPAYRETAPLVVRADTNEVVWIVGLCQAESAGVTAGPPGARLIRLWADGGC